MIYPLTFEFADEIIRVSYDSDTEEWTYKGDGFVVDLLRESALLDVVGAMGEPAGGLPPEMSPVNGVMAILGAELEDDDIFDFDPDLDY